MKYYKIHKYIIVIFSGKGKSKKIIETLHKKFKFTQTMDKLKPKGQKKFTEWAKHFKVGNNEDIRFDGNYTHTDQTHLVVSDEIAKHWGDILKDFITWANDPTIYPLTDTSTFMRIFDAFQRLEQTLQITWDKVRPFASKERPPTIQQFLTK